MSGACPILGFLVEAELDRQLSDTKAGALWDAFMKLLQQRGLEAEGIHSRHTWRYRVRSEATQATDVDRTAIQEWAATQAGIVSCRVGAVHDLEAAL